MRTLFGSECLSANGQLPAGWSSACIGELCEFTNGLWAGNEPPFTNIGVIRNTNFTEDGTLDSTDIATLDVEERQLTSRRLEVGDIILEKSGGGPDQPVGRVALFDWKSGIYSFSNFTSSLRIIDRRRIEYRYLHSFLLWVYLSGLTEVMQTRSTGIRNLDSSEYKKIRVPLPPIKTQRAISDILNAEQSLIAGRIGYESAFVNQKRGLIQKLLTGGLPLEESLNPNIPTLRSAFAGGAT